MELIEALLVEGLVKDLAKVVHVHVAAVAQLPLAIDHGVKLHFQPHAI